MCLSRVAHVTFHNMTSFVSVHMCTAKKTLVPWTVLSLSPSEIFEDLRTSVQAGRFSIVKMSNELSFDVCLRWQRQVVLRLLSVQKNLTAADVISVYGHFVKFVVEPAGRPTGATNTVHVKNAFEVMMQGRLTVSTPCLPNLMEEKRREKRCLMISYSLLRRKD